MSTSLCCAKPSVRGATAASALSAVVFLAAGCAGANQAGEPDDVGAATSTADTMTKELVSPVDGVAAWAQPPSDGAFNQYGYCGATAVANLLAWYGVTESPRTTIEEGCWSLVGATPGALLGCLQAHHRELGCAFETTRSGDSLDALRAHLAAGKPVVVLYKTGFLFGHWAVVDGVEGEGDAAKIYLMTDGATWRVPWTELRDRWSMAYGLFSPRIVCTRAARPPGVLPTR